MKLAGDFRFELEDHLAFENLISDLLARFLNMPESQLDQVITDAIRRIAVFLDLDQGLLIQWWEDITCPSLTHTWTRTGKPPAPDSPGTEVVPWIHQQVALGRIIMYSRVDDLPEEAGKDKEFFRSTGRRSLISLPMAIGGKVVGTLVFASLSSEILWPDEVVVRLQMIVDVFVGALDRQKSRRELEERLRFEMMLAETSARLINLPIDWVEDEIREVQRGVCESLDLDRSVLWLIREENSGRLELATFYQRGDVMPPSRVLDPKPLFPWTAGKLLAGKVVIIPKLSDLPPEAARDHQSFLSHGTKSTLVIPLSLGKGKVFGGLTFAHVRRETSWPEALVGRLKLVAQMFANVLARQHAERELRDRLIEIEQLKRRCESENLYLQDEVRQLAGPAEIEGQSVALGKVLKQARQVAGTGTTVLISGETGTGKELLARAIHNTSKQKGRPLVTVNCAALPPMLIESELFGRERGAYTGALTRMVGRFEIADGTTIFLDEIGELPLEVQGKLLRVIEEGTFERLGSTKSIHVDVRIIAATNRDLAREVKEGRFRSDLFYRLNVFPIVIPPLRERPEDITQLVWSFVTEFQKKMGKRIDNIAKKTMESLLSYGWPGNVRELRNVIERAMIVSNGRTLEAVLPETAAGGPPREEKLSLVEIERRHIMGVLDSTSWRVTGRGGAAEALGIKGSTLQSKMKKLGISRPHLHGGRAMF